MTDALVEAVARAMETHDKDHGWGMASATPGEYAEFARAAIAAIEASGTHVVVPKTPTPAMLVHASGFQQGEHIYAAFLSACPKQED